MSTSHALVWVTIAARHVQIIQSALPLASWTMRACMTTMVTTWLHQGSYYKMAAEGCRLIVVFLAESFTVKESSWKLNPILISDFIILIKSQSIIDLMRDY